MTNRWLKALSIFLSLVLIFNLLPLSVLAAEAQAALLQEETHSSAAADAEVDCLTNGSKPSPLWKKIFPGGESTARNLY